MAELTDFRLLSFDVYGTLIDWETGILNGLKPLCERVNLDRGQALKWANGQPFPTRSTLSKHYELVVLSNVDRESFSASAAGPLEAFRFDKIITAQDVGSYKPDLRNFEHMLKIAQSEFGIGKDQVLQTAQSQFHDHHPAKEPGIKSVWIERHGTMGNRQEEICDWKFVSLGDIADAVEQELGNRL